VSDRARSETVRDARTAVALAGRPSRALQRAGKLRLLARRKGSWWVPYRRPRPAGPLPPGVRLVSLGEPACILGRCACGLPGGDGAWMDREEGERFAAGERARR
jgi:hypothetical protein